MVARSSTNGFNMRALFILESETLNLQLAYLVPGITPLIRIFNWQQGSPVTLFSHKWSSGYIFKIYEPQSFGISSTLTCKLI